MRSIIRYLFPRIRTVDRLPLLPLDYSIEEKIIPKDEEAIRLLKGYQIARTDADARRVLRANPGKSVHDIVKENQRHRRRFNRIIRAIWRFKRLWEY